MENNCHSLNDFDPMNEDYFNQNYNSYDTGAGANLPSHLQPALYRKDIDHTFKVYVYPLSTRFDKKALKNLFSQFGEITNIYLDEKSNKWAFIYYKSQAAANNAISRMNDHPDFKFKVSYAAEKEKSNMNFITDQSIRTTMPRGTYNDMKPNVEEFFNYDENRKDLCEPSYQSLRESSSIKENYESNVMNGAETVTKPLQFKRIQSCFCCSKGTFSLCANCNTPFCSYKCSILGFDGHKRGCIQVAPLHDSFIPNESSPPRNSRISEKFINQNYCSRDVLDDCFNALKDSQRSVQNFSEMVVDYRKNFQNASPSTYKISNSYDDVDSELSYKTNKNVNDEINLDINMEKRGNINEKYNKDTNSIRTSSFQTESGNRSRFRNLNLAQNKVDTNEKEKEYKKSYSNLYDNESNNHKFSQKKLFSDDKSTNIGNGSKINEGDSFIGFGSRLKNKKQFHRNNHSNKPNVKAKSASSSKWDTNKENRSFAHSRPSRRNEENNENYSNNQPKVKSRVNNKTSSATKSNHSNRGSVSDDDFKINYLNSADHSSFNSNSVFTYSQERVKWSKNVRIKVKINEIDPTTVLILQEEELLSTMINEINSELSLQPLPSLEIKKKCLANRDGNWYRAVIENISPLSIRFVDMSCKLFRCSEQNIKQLPEKYSRIVPFCYSVKFENISNNELVNIKSSNTPVEIIPIQKDSKNVWLVELVRASIEEIKEINETNKKNVLNEPMSKNKKNEHRSFNEDEELPAVDFNINLKCGVPCEMMVSSVINETSFFVSDLSKGQALHEMIINEDIKSILPLNNAVIGSMCLAPFDDMWFRAKIMSLNPLKVAFIDFGNVENCQLSDLKILPNKYFKINDLAIPVRLEKGTIQENNINQDENITIIPVDQDLTEKMWIVQIQGSPLEDEIVKNVFVVYTKSKTEYFVIENSNRHLLDEFLRIDENAFINECTITPEKNSLYFAFFDGCWSRAVVTETCPLTVKFIDFGNEEKIELEDLRILPEKWKNIQPLAFKIVLKSEYTSEIIEDGNEITISKDSENYWKIIKKIEPSTHVSEKSETESFVQPVEEFPKFLIKEKDVPTEEMSTLITETIEDGEKAKFVCKHTSNKESITKDLIENKPVEMQKTIQIGETVEVFVMADLGEKEYSVMLFEQQQLYKKMTSELKSCSSTLKNIEKPQIGQFCVICEELSYRARIVELNPLRIFYLDFGYEDFANICDLRCMPQHLTKINPLGFIIVLEDEEYYLEERNIVLIEILDQIEENFYFVKHLSLNKSELDSLRNCTENDQRSSTKCIDKSKSCTLYTEQNCDIVSGTSVKMSVSAAIQLCENPITKITYPFTTFGEEFMSSFPVMPTIKSIFDELRNNMNGVYLVARAYTSNQFSGLYLPQGSTSIDVYSEKVEPDPNYKPKIGKLIATKPDNSVNWERGFVLRGPSNIHRNYTVSLIDKGEISNVSVIAPLADALKSMSSMALTCEVASFPQNKVTLKTKTYKCEITSFSILKRKAVGILWKPSKEKSENTCYKVTFKPWTPFVDEVGVQYVNLSSGDRVKITSMNSSNECFVVVTNDDDYEKRMEIMEAVTKYCTNAESLNQEPYFGEIVGVFSNDSFYRGQILEKEKDLYRVCLMDHGMEINVSVNDMRSIPEYLKLPYRTAVPVVLKDLPLTYINDKTRDYLRNIISLDKEFELIIDECSTVTLQFLDCEDYKKENDGIRTLNDYLNYLLRPEWKFIKSDCLDFREHKFMHDCLQYDEYEVGAKLKLYVVQIDQELTNACMINKRGNSWKTYVKVNLKEQLREYSESVNDSYVPSVNELCIAKYENQWCRALCLERNPGKTILLHLVDEAFIISCWHTNIRKMVAEFLPYKASAMVCYINDRSNIDSKNFKKQSIEKKEISGCVIVECMERPEYRITIKNIEKYFS